MVADESRLSFASGARSRTPDLLIAVCIDPKQVIARNRGHVLEANGTLQCPL
ncbi:hypothetical protein [Brucella anthropi]|uniref:hypothetical protein n=1 Tax=Brucella anthropi TaxID=529 RepID=UPI001F380DA8|nr:hypothetical protein [Brucella anthropi]